MEHVDIFGQVERELDLAFGALQAGNVQALEQLSAAVLSSSQNLLQSAAAFAVPRSRLQQVATLVQSLREALLRHAVVTDQALQTLVPATQSHTYGAGVAGAGLSPYGAVARSSGRMTEVLKA